MSWRSGFAHSVAVRIGDYWEATSEGLASVDLLGAGLTILAIVGGGTAFVVDRQSRVRGILKLGPWPLTPILLGFAVAPTLSALAFHLYVLGLLIFIGVSLYVLLAELSDTESAQRQLEQALEATSETEVRSTK